MEQKSKSADKVALMYELYEQEMFRVCLAILGDASTAEDALSESFLKLIRFRDRISDPRSPASRHFAMKTAKSTAIDLYRKKGRERGRVESLSELSSSEPTVEDVAERMEGGLCDEALKKLDPKYRIVFECIAVDGLTTLETASLLRVTESCVRKRLERARHTLRQHLSKKNGAEEKS